jgi:hypothetical protein
LKLKDIMSRIAPDLTLQLETVIPEHLRVLLQLLVDSNGSFASLDDMIGIESLIPLAGTEVEIS